jgi:hypothetical protein
MLSIIINWFGSCGSNRRRSTVLHDSALTEVDMDLLTWSDGFNDITITMPVDDVSKHTPQSDEINDEITTYYLTLSNYILDMM